jgi:SAM-dependent methyltransferase
MFEEICCPTDKTKVFITEAITPLYDLIRERYPETTGSEFSQTAARGEVISAGGRKVLMQDVTRLTFPADHFDCILSFDVLEHVPDYKAALREFARVLRKGGNLLLSVPFTFELKTAVRATVKEDGSVRHVLPPEYHGDPMSNAGVLCYQTFMDLLRIWKIRGSMVATWVAMRPQKATLGQTYCLYRKTVSESRAGT